MIWVVVCAIAEELGPWLYPIAVGKESCQCDQGHVAWRSPRIQCHTRSGGATVWTIPG